MRMVSALVLFPLAVGGCSSVSPLAVDGQASAAGGTSGALGTGGHGTGGTGGAVGFTPCQDVLALDRSCAVDADCIAVPHAVDCWPKTRFLGLRSSEQARFNILEVQCDRTFGIGTCPQEQAVTDDGSRLSPADRPGLTCLRGICTTYVTNCGGPCPSGTTCFSCVDRASQFAACTTTCTGSLDCVGPTLPLCQYGASGNTSGMFCTASGVACDSK
jgi:hypothetical protein